MDTALQKNKTFPDVELNLVMVHGVWSDGNAMDEMATRFTVDKRLGELNAKVSVIKYGKLLLSVGQVPFVRKLVSNYIASRLATCTYKYPNAKTIVLAHSFGTWAIAQAIKDLFLEFRLDMAILVGSVIPRNYDWSGYGIAVHNFVGKKDRVVLSSALWGTGWSGRYGFHEGDSNVIQYFMDWDHDDYPKGYNQYVEIIRNMNKLDSGKKGQPGRFSFKKFVTEW